MPYDETSDDYHKEPFTSDVSEGKNDPIYMAHSYHTKVPDKAVNEEQLRSVGMSADYKAADKKERYDR